MGRWEYLHLQDTSKGPASSHTTMATGTINGTGFYTFRMLADNNSKPGAGSDYFHIKIWKGTDMSDLYYKANNTIAKGDIKVQTK